MFVPKANCFVFVSKESELKSGPSKQRVRPLGQIPTASQVVRVLNPSRPRSGLCSCVQTQGLKFNLGLDGEGGCSKPTKSKIQYPFPAGESGREVGCSSTELISIQTTGSERAPSPCDLSRWMKHEMFGVGLCALGRFSQPVRSGLGADTS